MPFDPEAARRGMAEEQNARTTALQALTDAVDWQIQRALDAIAVSGYARRITIQPARRAGWLIGWFTGGTWDDGPSWQCYYLDDSGEISLSEFGHPHAIGDAWVNAVYSSSSQTYAMPPGIRPSNPILLAAILDLFVHNEATAVQLPFDTHDLGERFYALVGYG